MSNVFHFRGGPLAAGPIFEHTNSINAVLIWDASGKLSDRDKLASKPIEFSFLALDVEPIQQYIKRSPPGVYPIVWDAGLSVPNYTLTQLIEAEGAALAAADLSTQNAASTATNRQAIEQLLNLSGGMAGLAAIVLSVFDSLPPLPTDGSLPDAGGWFKNGDANGFTITRINPKA